MSLNDRAARDELARLAYAKFVADDTQRVADLLEQVAALETRLLQAQDGKTRHEPQPNQITADEQKELKGALANKEAALVAYRAEVARLKADLKRIRSSMAWKVGRTVTKPVGAVKRLTGTSASGRSENAGRATPRTTGEERLHTGQPAEISDSIDALPEPEPPLWSLSYRQLVDKFVAEPSSELLSVVLNRAWFQEGHATESLELASRFPDEANDLKSKEANLVALMQGVDRVLRSGIDVPRRLQGAAYQPVKDKVMYCVHSTPVYDSNGYSTRTEGIAQGLVDQGLDVVVVARSHYPWDTGRKQIDGRVRTVVERNGVAYVHLPGQPLPTTPIDEYILETADAFVREALLQRPAVIHAASNHRTGMAALIAARRLGLPFVYEVRGLWELTEALKKPVEWRKSDRFAIQVLLEDLVCAEADQILTITAEVKQHLVERGVAADRIGLLPNSADLIRFAPLPRDEKYASTIGLRPTATVLGFAGSLVEYEGLDLLIHAVHELVNRGRDVQLVVAGSGSAEASLGALAGELGLQSDVIFLGRLDPGEMPRLYSVFDIMPCPRISSDVTELVSPLKPLEAMASAKPVVLSDVSPHRTIAGEDEQRAILFQAGDVDSLTDAIERLLSDPELGRNLGRAGRLWILDERNTAANGRRLADCYARARLEFDRAALEGKPLRDIRLGLIADTFTTETLAHSLRVTALDRVDWKQQLDNVDAVLVESAWEGNNGQWYHGVGHYSDLEFENLTELLSTAKARGIPTLFWNKEDPVHTDRFLPAALLCDHVFSTDADVLPRYLREGLGSVRTASALPFFVEPRIHNPLGTDMPVEDTVAYAGTYYGKRYAKRSEELLRLLDAAAEFGLAIYDRQANDPKSPYGFPDRLRPFVRGGLPYSEILKVYRSHIANINVNSVSSSPSMYSRRVVEIAASGGVVLSGPGRGVDETFAGAIPATDDPRLLRGYLHLWSRSPGQRNVEAWNQMRAVYRSHTARTSFTVALRTAGIGVTPAPYPGYGVVVGGNSHDELIQSLKAQTWPPAVIVEESGSTPPYETVDFWARLEAPVPQTWAEDLLMATQFAEVDRIVPRFVPMDHDARPLASFGNAGGEQGMVRGVRVAGRSLDQALQDEALKTISLSVPWEIDHSSPSLDDASTEASFGGLEAQSGLAGRKVLIAGHDLKFAKPLLEKLYRSGARVAVDQWQGHNAHDERASLSLLNEADIVMCEWGLGNLEWYSKHVKPHQRLITRVHLQELERPYLAGADSDAVDSYIFVGDLIRRAAVVSHGVPEDKTTVIPNLVRRGELDLEKEPGAEFNLGFVGAVPQRKRLDLALDVLESVLQTEPRYRLFIKGKMAADFPWMAHRPEELAWYEAQDTRIQEINERYPGAVVLDGHGDDMPEWYRKIGVVLSVSDFESFHLTIPDGAASGAMPAVLAWDGADSIYPREWLSADVAGLCDRILNEPRDPKSYKRVVEERFDPDLVLERLLAELVGSRSAAAS